MLRSLRRSCTKEVLALKRGAEGIVLAVAVATLCLMSFAAGTFVGVKAGAFSTRIDFCLDDTSGRYIPDFAVRRQVCQDRTNNRPASPS